MLFAGWEVRIVKNCDRGLKADPKPVNHFFQALNEKKTLTEKSSRKRYCDSNACVSFFSVSFFSVSFFSFRAWTEKNK